MTSFLNLGSKEFDSTTIVKTCRLCIHFFLSIGGVIKVVEAIVSVRFHNGSLIKSHMSKYWLGFGSKYSPMIQKLRLHCHLCTLTSFRVGKFVAKLER